MPDDEDAPREEDARKQGGAPRRAIGSFNFVPYIEAVFETFRIGPTYETQQRTTIGWACDRWRKTRVATDGAAPNDPETIRGILTGRERSPVNRTHLQVLHRVLGLPDFGLGVDETWLRTVDGTVTLRDLDAFKALIEAARLTPRDPLRLIKDNADARSFGDIVQLDPPQPILPPARLNAQLIGGLENHGKEPRVPPRGAIHLMAKGVAVIYFRPVVRGRVLLINLRHEDNQTLVLNERIGVPRTQIHEPDQRVMTLNFPVFETPGENSLIFVNWPEAIDPVAFNLARPRDEPDNPSHRRLFDRDTLDVTLDEIRQIGVAMEITGARRGTPGAAPILGYVQPIVIEGPKEAKTA